MLLLSLGFNLLVSVFLVNAHGPDQRYLEPLNKNEGPSEHKFSQSRMVIEFLQSHGIDPAILYNKDPSKIVHTLLGDDGPLSTLSRKESHIWTVAFTKYIKAHRDADFSEIYKTSDGLDEAVEFIFMPPASHGGTSSYYDFMQKEYGLKK